MSVNVWFLVVILSALILFVTAFIGAVRICLELILDERAEHTFY